MVVAILVPKENVLFIHNPKTAGTSMREVLIKRPGATELFTTYGSWHLTSRELMYKVHNKKFHEAWKFVFVRNPWEWFVSMYENSRVNQNRVHRLTHNGFAMFVHKIIEGRYFQQEKFIEFVDFIGRYENLQEDWERVCEKLGRDNHLPHLNRSRQDASDGFFQRIRDYFKPPEPYYRSYYNHSTKNKVLDYNRQIIERFNYTY